MNKVIFLKKRILIIKDKENMWMIKIPLINLIIYHTCFIRKHVLLFYLKVNNLLNLSFLRKYYFISPTQTNYLITNFLNFRFIILILIYMLKIINFQGQVLEFTNLAG